MHGAQPIRVRAGSALRRMAGIGLAGALLLGAHAAAQVPAEPPAPVQRYLRDARLVGDGTLRWFGLRIYDARLWAQRPEELAARWPETPFALEIEYARALDGAAIAERSRDEMERLGYGTPQQHERWLARMRELFPDVRAGSRLLGVYQPGRGASFYSAQGRLGEVADPEFARAFFAIWLDERSTDRALRAALLAEPSADAARNTRMP